MQQHFARLLPTPKGIALAGEIIAKRNPDGTFAVHGREKEIYALLSAAYGKSISLRTISYIKCGSELLAQATNEELEQAAYPYFPSPYARVSSGNDISVMAKSLMLFALSGLNDMEDVQAGKARLAKMLATAEPDALLKSYGFPTWAELTKDEEDDSDDDEDDDDSEDDDLSVDDGDGSADDGDSDFNAKHPRWPADSPDSAGGEFRPKDEDDSMGENPENVTDSSNSRTLTYNTVEGGQNLSSWSVQWQLSQPSEKGGIVVQEVTGQASVSDDTQTISQPYHYWEAWTVPAGSNVTQSNLDGNKYDDIFINNNAGGNNLSGTDSATTITTFHEGMTLPPTFISNNPHTFAGSLPSTTINPNLPSGSGTTPVVRTWTVKF